jgi:hypothetical protein
MQPNWSGGKRPKSRRGRDLRFVAGQALNPPSAQVAGLPGRLLRRLPPLAGAPIRIHFIEDLRDRHGAAHGGAFLRERRIALNCACVELPRILAHELFHFVWFRLGNAARRSWEEALRREIGAGARGELGWSAEWRKRALQAPEVAARQRRWREYCCESFCDTAAWLFSGIARHEEFTLAQRFRERRRAWFIDAGERGPFSI